MSLTDHPREARDRGVVLAPVVFTATIFLSASLLFFVQPLFAKLILPRIGGAPAVWTTAMLFFQSVLIAGYVYAHLLIRYAPPRVQPMVHLAVWAIALFFLPLSVSEGWQYDPDRSTAVQTLWLLAIGVGAPFAMLSANAPLLQAWYARSGGPSAQDPYFLYGASNAGSLLALLAFPLLAEPFFGAETIGLGWAAGFVLLGGGLAVSGLMARSTIPTATEERSGDRPHVFQIARWLFLAFVPSCLMLAVTTEISTDLGSFPLIWVVPLALYILSFVLTFSTRGCPARLTRPAALVALAVMGIMVTGLANAVPSWLKALALAPALFALAVEAHRMLYASRPGAHNLTIFYVTMSVGGALGGLANSILAPWALSGVHEGALSVLLASALVMMGASPGRRDIRKAVVATALGLALLYAWGGLLPVSLPDPVILVSAAVLVGLAAIIWTNPLAVVAPLVLVMGLDALAARRPYLFKDRSFFGAHSVREEDGLRIYTNGTTIHGQMFTHETGRPTPLSYYHPAAPMAQVLTSEFGTKAQEIGIVGLGVGSLACYALPGQTWSYYEIDGMVDQVARDPALFRFLSECTPEAPTYLGDARVVLEKQSLGFDILVLDAYSSDAIPLHLVTREAMALYLERLNEGGLLVFHISNRYYDIAAPLARIGAALGLSMAIQHFDPDPDDPSMKGAKASVVALLAPDPATIAPFLDEPRWTRLTADAGAPWTDDFANLLSALRR